MYYDSNLQIHQQQYTTYNTNNISDISSAHTTNNGARQKRNSTNSNTKQHANKDQQNYHQDQRYQNQQAPRHRNNYARAINNSRRKSDLNIYLEYNTMQMSGTHNYYGSVRRAAHGGGRNSHTHDLSSKYYYEYPQQHYNNRYNY
ncbi:unnamed protein product [Adineta steineri]|uniref:Uncharacterized protein n=1 Tax=Adineta steineri TaxID=433720 RepID=A0A819HU96_9BILA|nr:unnamed protein product [Adineta steineri]